MEKIKKFFAKLKKLYLSFVYKKLISRLAHCRIYHKKEILKFFIANRKCRLLFYQFFDKSIKVLGPDTRIKIKKEKSNIFMITYIDNRLDNKYDLGLKVTHYADPYYALAKPAFSKYGWTYPNFYVRIDYIDR